MIVREILTKLGFQVEHDKLDRTEQQLESIKNRLGFLSGVELAKGLFELGERFATFAEQLHVAAESAGLTVETFQKLTFSARQSAVSQEEMEHSLVRLSRALYNAKVGGAEAQKAFYLAGINQNQITSFKTSQDALFALADRFKAIKDPVQKAALAQELLGRGSIHLIGYLSQGSAAMKAQGAEAQRLGLIISGGQVEALVRLEHALQKVSALFQAIGARIASYFAPILEYVINDFLRLVSANRSLIELNVESFLRNVAYGLGYVWGVLKTLIPLIVEFAKKFHVEGEFVNTLAQISGFAGGLLAVSAAFKAIGTAIGFALGPAGQLYIVLLALYKLEQKRREFAENKELQKDVFSKIHVDPGKDLAGVPQRLGQLGQSIENTFNVVVHAVTGASADQIGSSVVDAIKEHHALKMREAQAGTASGVVR